MSEIGNVNERSFFQRVVVRYRVFLGVIFGLALPFVTLPQKFEFMKALPDLVIGRGPTPYSIALGFPLAILGEGIRTWSSGILVKNRALTKGGPYALTRNPLYFGSFFIAVGMSIMSGSPLYFAVVAVSFAIVYNGLIRKEEKYLMGVYGKEYLDFCEAVPRFIPSFKNWPPEPVGYDINRVMAKHKEWQAWLAVYAAIVYMLACAVFGSSQP